MSEQFDQNAGLSRRTMVKGAAWSVPVLAAAVAAPMASASTAGKYDVGVAAECNGNYDLDKLLNGISAAINGVTIAGIPIGIVLGTLLGPVISAAQDTVEGLLDAIGLKKFVNRGFTVTAVEGTIPVDTEFTLDGGGLIDLTLLPGILQTEANALGLVSINGNTATLKLLRDLTVGESQHFTLQGNAIDLSVAGTVSFGLVGQDDPSTAPGFPNSVSQNFVVVETNLGDLGVVTGLLDAIGAVPGIGSVLGRILSPVRTALEAVAVTVQLCPGQPNPVA